MPRKPSVLLLLVLSVATSFALAQKEPVPAKPQTPRQALIEVVTKGGDSVLKHMTVEVQELLLKPENKSPALMAIGSMKPESGLEAFEAGDVLFRYSQPAQHLKYEVVVDSDDLAGTEDTFQLSLHMFQDGKEENPQFGLMSPHFTVSMKQQQNIWRLNKISVGADFPIGDPEFVKGTFLKNDTHVHTTGLVATTGGPDAAANRTQPVAMPPEQVVTMLGFAESTYARMHPDQGFTCSLSELEQSTKMMGLDQQISTGSYNGYRFALSGCEGKPAGSYQLIAEPLTAGSGEKAFCSDATQNLRMVESGTGANCLAFGKVQSSGTEGEVGGAGFTFYSPLQTNAKPENELH